MPNPAKDKQDRDPAADKALIEQGLKRFKLAAEAESEQRSEAIDDFQFRRGKTEDHWAANVIQDRKTDNTPCMVLNLIPSFVRQVTNEQRQQRPNPIVKPVGENTDPETAEIVEGVIRHIYNRSQADLAHDTAFDHSATGGIGWWRLGSEYANDDTNDQEILISPINNWASVYSDPNWQKPDGSDARFRFIITDLTDDEYKTEFEDSDLAESWDQFQGSGNAPPDWLSQAGVRVAEYFYIDEKWKTNKLGRRYLSRSVKWAKMNAFEVLDRRDLPGTIIPVFPVYGEELNIDGKRTFKGLVRDLKSAQRQYNFMNSAATETIGMTTKAPYVVAKGQTENYPQWDTSNTRKHGRLIYDFQGGNGAPPPQRNVAEPPIQAIMEMIRQTPDDMKRISGIYDPSLGKGKADQSGKAIQSLQQQSATGTFNFSDNLQRTLALEGKVVLQWIPVIYDTDRIQRIIRPDQSAEMVKITNSRAQEPPQPDEPDSPDERQEEVAS